MLQAPTDEIRAARRELSARLGNDIHLIAEETRRRQQESGRMYLTLPPRPLQPVVTPLPERLALTNHAASGLAEPASV